MLNPIAVTWAKIETFTILENRFFGYNSSSDCPISEKFCVRKHNGMPTKATWQKVQIFKIHDGGRPPFWKSLYCRISLKNLPILMTFGTQYQILNPITVTWPKIEIFKIWGGDSRHLENRFFDHYSLIDCVISVKFWISQQNGMPTNAAWQKMQNFQNPRWRTTDILKMVKSPYLIETITGFWQNLVYYSICWTWWGL